MNYQPEVDKYQVNWFIDHVDLIKLPGGTCHINKLTWIIDPVDLVK